MLRIPNPKLQIWQVFDGKPAQDGEGTSIKTNLTTETSVTSVPVSTWTEPPPFQVPPHLDPDFLVPRDLLGHPIFSASTPETALRRLRKSDVPAETFLHELRADPVGTYAHLESQGEDDAFVRHKPILLKLIADLNERLVPGSVLELPRFADFRERLARLQTEAIEIFRQKIPYARLQVFVLDHAETLDALFRSADPSLKGTYHRDFAERLIRYVMRSGDGTHAFFTFEPVDDQYFEDIRPSSTYLHWMVDAPAFTATAATYAGGALVPASELQKRLDGLDLPPDEVIKHDVGHSYYMKRQDAWLFKFLGGSREERVAEWNEIKNRFREERETLESVDPELATAVRFMLTEVTHERGYQYFLPILRQQFASPKWIAMLGFKKKNRYWGDRGLSDTQFARLDEARLWLLDLTDRLLKEENLSAIERLSAHRSSVTVRQWRPIVNFSGIPVRVDLKGIQDVRVEFDMPGQKRQSTSLYEIALVLAPTAETPILTPEKIDAIEKWIWRRRHSNDVESLVLTSDGIVQATLKTATELSRLPETVPEDEKLSKIEIYKLERLLNLMAREQKTEFTVTLPPETFYGTVRNANAQNENVEFLDETGRIRKINLVEASFHEGKPVAVTPPDKYVNLDAEARFVDESVLRQSYERYGESLNPQATPYVTLRRAVKDRETGKETEIEIELAMVDTGNPVIAKAVSSLLTRSLEDAKYTNGGYLPPEIVKRVQTELVSPHGVHNLWGRMGRRFVLSRPAANGKREIVGSALVGESRDNIFFFTSRFNNLRHTTLRQDLDFGYSADGHPDHRWFDKFNFPDVDRYKPKGYHHLANFVVEREGARGLGLARLMIEGLLENYSREYLQDKGLIPPHSQRLLCGKGFWQIGDPPWLARMGSLGFIPRLGAESFHVDVEWDPLIPTYDRENNRLDHVAYNRSFGLPQMYLDLLEGRPSPYRRVYEELLRAHETGSPPPPGEHMPERISTVIDLALSGRAKIQYFQLLFPFERYFHHGTKRDRSE
jgi:hypothetical protein